MKFTPYGFFVTLASITFLCITKKLPFEIGLSLILSIFIQSKLCHKCNSVYSLASYLSILPILILLFVKNCHDIKLILFAFSISFAIGRIGCYFAGCCTGKEVKNKNDLGITYKEGSVVVDKYTHRDVKVYPTIFLEIIFQFFIAYTVFTSQNGMIMFGVLNAMLVALTNTWRMGSRMNENSYRPILGLLLFSYLSSMKCAGNIKNIHLNIDYKHIYSVFAIVLGIIVSNDINFKKNITI
jgi:prolipoprotein diacylglyceryltransferase